MDAEHGKRSMKPSSFTDTQELLIEHARRSENRTASVPEKTETDNPYPRELNKGGIVISAIISVVVMVILLVVSSV